MSRTIDEKVVEMRFDNSDFERNVTQSMSTLDKLKSALDFSGASKAFDGITSAANKVDLGGLTGAFDGVHEKVTNLEKVINGFFENVGRRLSNFAIDQVKGVTVEPVMEGFSKYEQKSKAVQTIMNATGQSIEDVSAQLEKLLWYTDETSYDFAEMVTTVGKFTSAGVDLDRSVTAMQAIGNWAAVSGAEKQQANMAMYNLAQALGMGFVGAADYRSIMNANMDTREFKQMVIDEAIKEGTLAVQTLEDGTEVLVAMNKETKELIYENEKEGKLLEVNADNFYSTLTKGKWFDRDVLLNVTDKYGRFSNLLYQFYNDVADNGFDVTTSELIAYVDAYRDGTLDMNDAIKETGLSAEYLTDVLTQLSSEEFELSEKAFKAGNEARTFKDAIDATKDAVSTAWMSMFELLFGNYEEARVLWTDLSNELWDIFAGPINSINDMLSKWRKIELDDGTIVDGRDDFINGIKDIYHALRSVTDPIIEAWEAIFPPIDQFQLYDITKAFADFTSSLVLNDVQMEKVKGAFEGVFSIVKLLADGISELAGIVGGGLWSYVTDMIGGYGAILHRAGTGIGDFVQGIRDADEALKATVSDKLIKEKYGEPIYTIVTTFQKLRESFQTISTFLENIGGNFLIAAENFTNIFDGVLFYLSWGLTDAATAVGDLIKIWTGVDLTEPIENVIELISKVTDLIEKFAHHPGWGQIKDGIAEIGTAFTDTFGGIESFFGPIIEAVKTLWADWAEGIGMLLGASGDLDGFFATITNGLSSIKTFIETDEGFANFINGIKEGIQFISDFLVKFLSLTDAIEVYQANGGGILGILAVINDKIGIIIDTFANLVQNVTGFDIHGIGDGILSVIQGIGYAILQLADTIAKTFGWKDNPFGKLLGQIDSEYTGFDGISVNLVGVFQRIGDAFSKLGEVFTAVSPGISSALSGVKVVLLDVIQFFKDISADMSFPDLLRLIMQVITVFSGIKLAKKAGEMFEAIGDALAAWQKTLKVQMLLELAGAILMIAGAAVLISKIDNDKIGLVLGTLATAFLGLIGVLAVSRAGNADNLKALPGIIISVAAAMVVLSFAANKLADVVAKFGQIENFGDAFGNFAGTLVTISILIGALAGLNAKLTAKDGLTNTNVLNGIVTAIGKLAVSMLLLLGVIKLYQMVDFKNILIGLGEMIFVLAGASAAMGGAEFLFNLISTLRGGFTSMESTATSMLKFAGAMAIFAAVAGALTLIKWGDLGNSLLKMVSIIAAFSAGLVIFGAALALLDKLKIVGVLDKVSDTIWKFAKSIAVLVGISVVIGLISEIFGDSLTDLVDKGLEFIEYAIHSLSERSATIAHDLAVIIVDIVREALRVLAENIPEITQYLVEILGGLIQGVKDALASGDLDLGEVLGGTGLFAGILGLVVFLKKNKVNVGDFGNAALAIGGAALLILEIGVLFEAIGWLADRIGGAEGLKKMQEFASGIVHVFTDDWGVLAMFGVLMAVELLASKFGIVFGHASGIFEGFKTAGALVLSVVGLLDELGLLFAASGALLGTWGVPFIQKAGELYKAIADIFAENNGGVTLLFIAIAGILAVFSKFKLNAPNAGTVGDVIIFLAEAVGVIDALGLLFAATGGIIEAIKAVGDEVFGGGVDIVQWVVKAGEFFEAIGAAIGKLVGGLVGGIVNGTIKEATDGVTQDMIDLLTGMGECLKVMSEAGLIAAAATWAGGPIGLEIMAQEMANMAPHFVKFAEGVGSLSHETAEKAKICAEALQALIALVPETGGIKQWWNGEINIPLFAKGIYDMADAITHYAGKMEDLTAEDIGSLKDKTERIAEVLTTLKDLTPETNVGMKKFLEGANDLGTFGQTLSTFADNLVYYCDILKSDGIDLDIMRDSMVEIKKITGLATDIGTLGGDKIHLMFTFGNDLYSLAQYIKNYVNIVSKLKAENVGKSIGYTQTIIDMFLGTDNLEFGDKVATLTTEFLDKLSAAFGGNDAKAKADTAADNYIDYFRDRILWDGTIGKISIAMQNMINQSVYDKELVTGLRTGGNDMVTELQDGIVEKFEGEEGLSAKFTSFLESLLTSIATDGPQGTKTRYYNAGADLIKSLMNGMLNEEKIKGFGSPAALQLKEGFKALLDSLIGLIVSEEMQGQFNRGGASLINAMLGGIKSVDVETEMKSVGKNATLGYANGMVDQEALNQVAKSAKAATDVGINTAKTNLAEKSPSRVTMLIGQFFTQGFANGIYDKIPNAKEAVLTLMQKVKEGMGQNDLISLANKLGLNLDGALDDHIANLISQHGLDDFLNGDLDEMANSIMGALSNGEIYSGGGMESFNSWMSSFQAEYENSIPDLESMAQGIPEVFGTSMEEYANSGYVTNGAAAITDNVSDVFGEFYDASGDYGYSVPYTYADNMLTASEEIQPVLATVTENMTAPVEDGLTEMLTYAEWVAKQYPEGLTKELSAPVFNFDDLYENMKGGELEAILNMFDAMDETGRRNLIRAYGLGEEGGNADLANYLQWYWKNEPTRMQNLDSIKQATEGYQAYLDEQKALQEAQAVQSQKNYEGVQQIAADMQTQTDEANARHLAYLAEIKMDVAALREELSGVHADIAELNNMDVYIDSSALVGATAEKYNEELGNMAKIGRRRVTR